MASSPFLASSGAPPEERQPPTERAAPWYLTPEQIANSPSQSYFMSRMSGCTVEKARSKEQEYRQATCSFLQESGQKLRL